jgi:iron complex outermembrane receptor protein
MAVGLVSPAMAQQPSSAANPQTDLQASDTLQEIVVTAQKRAQNLQDVPIAATALSGDALAGKAVTRVSDLQFASPSLSVTDAGLTQSVNIRGIGLASGSPAVANGVATYVDGLFQPPILTTSSFYDIADIEVLRGPQGTLVGSNSTGGAIFINSRSPTLDQISGYGEVGGGNFGTWNGQGAINLPATDYLAVRAAFNVRNHDSYYTDYGAGNHPARLDEKAGRVGVLLKPAGGFQALLKVEFVDRSTGGYAWRPIGGTPYASGLLPGIRSLDYDEKTFNKESGFQSSLELKYETAGGTVLRSISGYQNKRSNNSYDLDATILNTPTQPRTSQIQHVRERVWTEEVNIVSPTNKPLTWIVGGYFQRNRIDVGIDQLSDGFPTRIDSPNKKTTTGLFAQASYSLTPKLQIELGGRYSHYAVTGTGAVKIGAGIPGFPPTGLTVADLTGRYKDGRATGKAAINWKVSNNNLIYAFVARGYKSGGFNSATSTFGPETVINYEVGWKSTMLDGHLRSSIDAFYNDYKGFQFGATDITSGQNGVTNIAGAKIKGIEAQLQGKFGGLGFDLGGAYVDSKLDPLTIVNTRFLPPGTLGPQCAAGVPSNPPTCFDYGPYIQTNNGGRNLFSPKFTFNAGVQYEFPVGEGMTLTPRVNYAYVASQFTTLFYSPVTDLLPARGLVSALVTLRRGRWSIEAYGTNLANKEYVSGQSGNNEFYGPPREYGVRAHVNF